MSIWQLLWRVAARPQRRPQRKEGSDPYGRMALRTLMAALIAHQASALAPRAHVMSTHLHSADYYEALCADGGFHLRLLVKFQDELEMRAAGPGASSTLRASWSHVRDINRTLSVLSATMSPALGPVGEEWEALVSRAETLSGRAQPDLRALVVVELEAGHTTAVDFVAAAQALSGLHSVEFAEIDFAGVPPPTIVHRQEDAMMPFDCPVPPPGNGTKHGLGTTGSRATPDFTSLQLYSRAVPGFDADWAADQGANGAGVRYSDCEYCWVFDHEDVTMIKEEGHPCDPNMFADHGTASVGVTTGIINGYGITGIAPSTEAYTYSEWTDQGGRRERAIAQAVA